MYQKQFSVWVLLGKNLTLSPRFYVFRKLFCITCNYLEVNLSNDGRVNPN